MAAVASASRSTAFSSLESSSALEPGSTTTQRELSTLLSDMLATPIKFRPSSEKEETTTLQLASASVSYMVLDDETNAKTDGVSSAVAPPTAPKRFIGPIIPPEFAVSIALTSNSVPAPPPASSQPIPSASSSAASEPSSSKKDQRVLHKGEIPTQWPAAFRGPASGLNNVGNTCYMNSVLQSLFHTPSLIHIMTQHKSCQNRNFCMICEFSKVSTQALLPKGSRSFTPAPITRNLKQFAKGLRLGRQEDAHEFLRYTVDAFQRSALAGSDPKLPHSVKETTWVHKIFGGRLRSRVECRICRHPSDTFDSLLDLSVDVRNRETLTEALKAFVAIDVLSGQNKYKCEKCKKPVVAEKQFTIHEAPQVLTVHLKRFTPLGRKMTHAVRYDETLNLQPYMSVGSFGPRYDLYAVISHAGSGPNSGHYYAHVKAPGGQWYEMNDDDVTKASRVPLNLKSAYILFYIRQKGGLLNSAVLGPPASIVPRQVSNAQKKRKANGNEEEDIGQKAGPSSSPPLAKKVKLQDSAGAALGRKIESVKAKAAPAVQSTGLSSLAAYGDGSSTADEEDVGAPATSLSTVNTSASTLGTSTPLRENVSDSTPLTSPNVENSPAAHGKVGDIRTPIPVASFYASSNGSKKNKQRRMSDENDRRSNHSKHRNMHKKHRHSLAGGMFTREALGGNRLGDPKDGRGGSGSARHRMKNKHGW